MSPKNNKVKVAVGMGSNLGNSYQHLLAAQQEITQLPQSDHYCFSSIYSTIPIDAQQDDPRYLNAVVVFETYLSATDVLIKLNEIELEYGRNRSYKNAPRTLDLDILLYGDEVISFPTLTVPHPRMQQRFFVLTPLTEVWGDAMHPTLKTTIKMLEKDLSTKLAINDFITITEYNFIK